MISDETMLQTEYEFEFKYPGEKHWLRTDLQCKEALDVIKTGLLYNKPVALVKLFAIHGEGYAVCFIYDIAAAKAGQQPWSTLCQET